ncbi:DinB family protein [Pseudokineococcus marinus]|uniref:DinB family protein n=1 Tax=Pseudokineococcus marinus TaxID=351215 RepID=A0A849BMD9_9ACTN|nr:DinB family protein [Pseudokineococcus marinus]NNH21962.1 DinB family protein [Pseudokineococcus marinus]
MFGPGTYSEREVLVGHLEEHLDALRAAAQGLTEEQARATPCRSSLSVGGLVKHVAHVLGGRLVADGAPTPDDRARFESSFALGDDETLAGAVADLDRVRAELLDRWHATDPGGDALEPPAPWFGRTEPTPSVERYRMVHLVTEVARHAGHADIVREQLDGASSTSLLAAVEGWPANDFVQPWRPPTDG